MSGVNEKLMLKNREKQLSYKLLLASTQNYFGSPHQSGAHWYTQVKPTVGLVQSVL
jgi:hypothetical protein